MRQLTSRVPAISPPAFAAAAALLIAGLAIPGAIAVRNGGGGPFDLDAEFTVPALASAALLLCASAAAAGVHGARPAVRRWHWAGLAGLFLLMAVDEATGLHEALERLSFVDWQTLYLPVMAFAVVLWALAFLELATFERLLFAGGALAWGAAQVLEALEWTGPLDAERAVDGYGVLMGFEELLEMAGSALFALALLLAIRRR